MEKEHERTPLHEWNLAEDNGRSESVCEATFLPPAADSLQVLDKSLLSFHQKGRCASSPDYSSTAATFARPDLARHARVELVQRLLHLPAPRVGFRHHQQRFCAPEKPKIHLRRQQFKKKRKRKVYDVRVEKRKSATTVFRVVAAFFCNAAPKRHAYRSLDRRWLIC